MEIIIKFENGTKAIDMILKKILDSLNAEELRAITETKICHTLMEVEANHE